MCLCEPVPLCNSYLSGTLDAGVSDETQLWEEILAQHDLTMDRGSSPSWLTYGWRYSDSDKAIVYGEDKRPDVRTGANFTRTQKLMDLIKAGMSQNAAAKQLGIAKQTASDLLKAHRVNLTCPESSTPVEGII